jgi:broad specificity phosphatase PhoE
MAITGGAPAKGWINDSMLFIRHAESVYNEAFSRGLEMAGVVDAPLSVTGQRQAQRLRRRLNGFVVVERVLTSPLTRALETSHILFGDSKARIVVSPLLAEHLAHPCDIGRPWKVLRLEFPRFDFSGVKEAWRNWDCRNNEGLLDPEPLEFVDRRCRVFLSWLQETGASKGPIAVVGHQTFFARLLGVELANCGVFHVGRKELFGCCGL